MLFKEAMPAGNDGEVASSLITQLDGYLQEGRPVYAEYNYPGLGQLFIQAVTSRDYPLVQSITIVTASIFVFLNFIADIVYSIVDPRIRA